MAPRRDKLLFILPFFANLPFSRRRRRRRQTSDNADADQVRAEQPAAVGKSRQDVTPRRLKKSSNLWDEAQALVIAVLMHVVTVTLSIFGPGGYIAVLMHVLTMTRSILGLFSTSREKYEYMAVVSQQRVGVPFHNPHPYFPPFPAHPIPSRSQ